MLLVRGLVKGAVVSAQETHSGFLLSGEAFVQKLSRGEALER
jgi:hypothetical protein